MTRKSFSSYNKEHKKKVYSTKFAIERSLAAHGFYDLSISYFKVKAMTNQGKKDWGYEANIFANTDDDYIQLSDLGYNVIPPKESSVQKPTTIVALPKDQYKQVSRKIDTEIEAFVIKDHKDESYLAAKKASSRWTTDVRDAQLFSSVTDAYKLWSKGCLIKRVVSKISSEEFDHTKVAIATDEMIQMKARMETLSLYLAEHGIDVNKNDQLK